MSAKWQPFCLVLSSSSLIYKQAVMKKEVCNPLQVNSWWKDPPLGPWMTLVCFHLFWVWKTEKPVVYKLCTTEVFIISLPTHFTGMLYITFQLWMFWQQWHLYVSTWLQVPFSSSPFWWIFFNKYMWYFLEEGCSLWSQTGAIHWFGIQTASRLQTTCIFNYMHLNKLWAESV